MITLIKDTLKAARNYTILDFAFLKVTLVSFGLLIGAYFADYFLKHTFVLWVVFIISFLWILYKTFMKYKK